ncbi:uncharacterized protein PV09_04460 [Verruconis gallopava]|uniref:Uncharacterized protein n=1 Tax=Verruconis gallopava TaxID=253628 RepID=A0A0D2ACT9_9PEZI|nr:uncharacterized protein PV09_04460 [Verruconis gallopava]KIW04728.1 hypothetical protein PV09_04460 [Verruconis gallopava]
MNSYSISNIQNSTANLRRARSANSVSVRRLPSLLDQRDPDPERKHALLAAAVAYERACCRNKHSSQAEQVSAQPRRRRSNRAGGFEGEGSHFHFHELKKPRRCQSKRISDNEDPTNHHPRSRRGTLSSTKSTLSLTSRSISTPMRLDQKDREDSQFKNHRSSISVHKVRIARSMCSSSSCCPEHAIDSLPFAPTTEASSKTQTLEDAFVKHSEKDFEISADVESEPVPPAAAELENVSELTLPPAIFSLGKDRSYGVRRRASMIFMPFKKRKSTVTVSNSARVSSPKIEHSHPSFANSAETPGAAKSRFQNKRTVSEVAMMGAIAAKIRSVLRRASCPQRSLPMQQVNASRAYFKTGLAISEQFPENRGNLNPKNSDSEAVSTPLTEPLLERNRGSSFSQSVVSIGTKSRVTSWADSTIAGSIFEAGDSGHLDAIMEESRDWADLLGEGTTHSTFGSMRLIESPDKVDTPALENIELKFEGCDNRESRRTKSCASLKLSPGVDLDRLPSQLRRANVVTKPNIQAVAPHINGADSTNYATEDAFAISSRSDFSGSDRSDSSVLRDRNSPNEAPALSIAAPPPTAEQIAHRVRRSEQRWHEPLDGSCSLFFPRSPKDPSPKRCSRQNLLQCYGNDNVQQSCDDNASFEYHDIQPDRATGLISPSVYSEDDNDRSFCNIHELSAMSTAPPNPDSGTAVILASQQVAKYNVGSKQRPRNNQTRETSREWRNWLHSEVQDLESPPPKDLQLSMELVMPNSQSGHRKELAQIGHETGDDDEKEKAEEGNHGRCTANAGKNIATQQGIVSSQNNSPALNQVHNASDYSGLDTATLTQCQAEKIFSTSKSMKEDNIEGSDNHSDLSKSSFKARKLPYLLGTEERPSSRLYVDERESVASRPSSLMNDRFPFLINSRPQSRTSVRSSTPAQSLHSKDSHLKSAQKMRPRSARRDSNNNPSPAPLYSLKISSQRPVLERWTSTAIWDRSQSSLENFARSKSDELQVSMPAILGSAHFTCALRSTPQRPTSALSGMVGGDDAIDRTKHISVPSLETDPTLASIIRGPYRSCVTPTAPYIQKSAVSSGAGLPLKENAIPRTPKRVQTTTPTSGQRLAEQFLNARKFREDLKVASPGEGSCTNAVELDDFSPAFL